MDVVKCYCFEWNSNKTDNARITRVVKSIENVWNRAGLPTRSVPSIRLKVKNLITSFKSIVSTRMRSNESQEKKENDFLDKSKRLFDVIDQKLEGKLCAVKLSFLVDQRNSRHFTFSDLYCNENNLECIDVDNTQIDCSMDIEIEEILSEQGYESDSEFSYHPSSSDDDVVSVPKKKLKTETIRSLDDAGLSFRQMKKVSEAFIKEFDENPEDYCIGTSSFHSNSTNIRRIKTENISTEIKDRNSKSVLLFDTKTCSQLNSAHLQREKRLAIVLYNEGCHFGLGINVVENGTADTLSDNLYEVSTQFNLPNRIIGLVSDTENANIGYRGGTCTKYEEKIQKQLLQFRCRHHMFEIMLKKICEKLLGTTRTPCFSFEGSDQIKIEWKHINKGNYRSLYDENFEDLSILHPLRDESLEQIQIDARKKDVRDDYNELNDICLKLLGIRTSKSIRVIGALSKARWIAKALLIGKTYLFREHLDLSEETLDALRRLCIFISHIYVKFWNRATSAVNAAINDLLFMQQLQAYKEFDDEIAQAAINSLKDHLWYLGGELITLSLFSPNLSINSKNKIRQRIIRNVGARDIHALKFIVDASTQFSDMNLEDFVNARSFFMFQLFENTADFLEHDARTWEQTISYALMKNLVEETIIVVNDGAERMLGNAEGIIKLQKARKEKYFQNLLFTKFDKNKHS